LKYFERGHQLDPKHPQLKYHKEALAREIAKKQVRDFFFFTLCGGPLPASTYLLASSAFASFSLLQSAAFFSLLQPPSASSSPLQPP
jgi:hypothetical protein